MTSGTKGYVDKEVYYKEVARINWRLRSQAGHWWYKFQEKNPVEGLVRGRGLEVGSIEGGVDGRWYHKVLHRAYTGKTGVFKMAVLGYPQAQQYHH